MNIKLKTCKDTPRTNDNVYTTYSEGNQGLGEEYAEYVVDADFARELERELATAQLEIDSLKEYKFKYEGLCK